jgi:hypothetical protein
MVKIQKQVEGNYIVSFPNMLEDDYSFIDGKYFMWCPNEKSPILVTPRSGSQ